MDVNELVRILACFTDDKPDVDVSRGRLVIQLHEELIEVRLSSRAGELYVEESGTSQRAIAWVIKRIARLDSLAESIAVRVPPTPHYVSPTGTIINHIEVAPEPQELQVPDAELALKSLLDRRTPGMCSVVYLTSDAGEGKTTVINHLAREQAQAYRKGATDWLLLPVALGGRPFLRFDEVVVGTLLNRLRFPLYFEAFVELVKLGVIVPALDGFEELFIENPTGDTVTALGTLVQTFRGEGSVLIAARTAYFNYKRMGAQTMLHDSLMGSAVSFAGVGLSRWSRPQFESYCSLRGLKDGGRLYEQVSERLKPAHPVVTRAVLVKKLLDIAGEASSRAVLLERLSREPHDFFSQFVDAILQREVEEKWIDTVGTPARPLLNVAQHHELLAALAQEMWSSGATVLRGDVVDSIAQLFCEQTRQPIAVSRQIVDRLKHHALISQSPSSASHLMFDHEEFYCYFLGEAVTHVVSKGTDPEIREVLGRGPLPLFALESAAHAARRQGVSAVQLVASAFRACRSEGPGAFGRENTGGLLARLIAAGLPFDGVISGLLFPRDALRGLAMHDLQFVDCQFQSTSLEGTVLQNCRFDDCRFERLDFSTSTQLSNTQMRRPEVMVLVPAGSDIPLRSPDAVSVALLRAGVRADDERLRPAPPPVEVQQDDELKVAERAIRSFLRATELNENSLKQQLGKRQALFFKDVLPELLRVGVIEEVKYHGAGQQRRFRLGAKLTAIETALADSDGQFAGFIGRIQGL